MLDDDSFELLLFEMQHGRVNFEAERLVNLKCNPLHFKNQKNLTLTHNIDSDSNFSNETLNCDFYTECSLINTLSDKKTNQCCLSVMHLNIRSLGRNQDCLQNLISSLNFMFSVIGISETWLQDSTHHVDINGFNFVHNHRSERTGGGVGLYIASALEFKTRTDLCFEDNAIAESLFVVGKISRDNKNCYIMGDFNLDLLNHSSHQFTNEFLDIMYANSFSPLITLPTRLTSHSATLIDVIVQIRD
jgi:hypothetical protein